MHAKFTEQNPNVKLQLCSIVDTMKCSCKKVLAKIASDAIIFFPQSIAMPRNVSKVASLDKAKDLIKLLRGKSLIFKNIYQFY